MSTHFLTEVRAHFNREMLCQMRTLSSETSFVEMGDEKFFQMVSKIWDKKLPKISQLHGNFVGKQTFSQEDVHFV